MAEGFFVTGTDTNAGKTVLSALLCAALPARYWKPIQTGSRDGTDREQVLKWTKMAADLAEPEAYIFDDPVSPHLAAKNAGVEIALSKIAVPETQSEMPVVAEGAGGVLVPINSREFMTDLMRHIGFPVVLGTRSTLGTINHTLLSLEALRGAGVAVLGVVMIGPENRDNRDAIERYGEIEVVGEIPPLPEINREALVRTFDRHFRKEAFQ